MGACCGAIFICSGPTSSAPPYELPIQLNDSSFFAFRADLFATYRPYDLHGIDYGFDYQLASWLAFVAALPFVAARDLRGRGTVAPL